MSRLYREITVVDKVGLNEVAKRTMSGKVEDIMRSCG